jgi:NAD(P)-dependent dehydrogenase (short-subunit alcohol dehydrogenase family)
MKTPKTMVVTGGTGGIGRQTAIALARAGASVVITGRDRARGEAGLRAVREASGSADVHLATGDLASLRETRDLARDLAERFPRIDVLVNNAGALTTSRRVTVDGLETDFAVNVVAPYVLTHALGAALAPGARVINVTGGLGFYGLDPTDLQAERTFLGLATYSRAKRALEAMSLELAEELRPRGVGVLVVFPGEAATSMSGGLTAASVPWWMRPLWPLFGHLRRDDGGASAAKAARSSAWAATSNDLDGVSGRAFDTNCRPMKLHATVRDRAARLRVVAEVRSAAAGPPVATTTTTTRGPLSVPPA